MDPEHAHEFAYKWIGRAGRVPVFRGLVRGILAPYLGRGMGGLGSVEVLGRTYGAPFGLAGGFDKDANAVRGLTMLGFSYIEIGTITPRAQPGNEAPRMFREIEMRGLRNRMGFNNEGAPAAVATLRRLRESRGGDQLRIGVNIGKNKDTPPEAAADDYATCARLLAPFADYLVVNVSSPNTPGLRDLQTIEALRPILIAARKAADEATGEHVPVVDVGENDSLGSASKASHSPSSQPRVPLLVKIAPDLSDEDVDAVADLALELGLDGVAAVNTTIDHDLGPGGLSGAPLLPRGLEVVARLRARLGEGPTIIGSGGIISVADAQAYLEAGADLIQGYTGFIYEGPLWPGKLNRALVRQAKRVRAAEPFSG
ncbi:MAG: dihydroorotate dehydrogenase (quinone) [Promicromonosporaceae bacterium]|nr:dihydroorotate dehydrogenase (quinone) [Promicromonosporaceae bacterium]